MDRSVVRLGSLVTSRIGLGTSAAYDGLLCPAKVSRREYPSLLHAAFGMGVRFWDTSVTYGTHGAVRAALNGAPRDRVVICTKSPVLTRRSMNAAVERSLRELGCDVIDVFMLQCVRGGLDLRLRRGALDALVEHRRRGSIRAIGLSSHGLGALEAVRDQPDIEIIMARFNVSGDLMDVSGEPLKATAAALPPLKRLLHDLMPVSLFQRMASSIQQETASLADRKRTAAILADLHARGKGIVGMKLLGEGRLAHRRTEALEYAARHPFLDVLLLGACSTQELKDSLVTLSSVGGLS